MIELLLTANAALTLCWCLLVLQQRAPKVTILIPAFHFVLFVVKPLASDYLDFVPALIAFSRYDAAYVIYLTCGLIFLSVVGLLYFAGLSYGKTPVQPETIEGAAEVGPTALMQASAFITFGVLIALSIAANIVRFSDPLYFIHAKSSFDAMLATVDSWYLNVLVECPLVAVAMVAGRISARDGLLKRLLVVIVLVAIFIFLSRPSTRTGAIAMLIAVLSESFLGRKVGAARFILIGAALVMAYVALSFLRLGEGVSFTASALLGIAGIFFVGFAPADLAVKLLSMMPPREYLWFRFLGGAADPLVVVPTALVPFEKPRADLEAYITGQYFGPLVDLELFTEGSTLTFTAPASAYLNLGYIGVVSMALIFAALLLLATRVSRVSRPTSRIIGTYWLITICAGYRYSVEGAVVGAYSFGVLVGIYLFVEFWVSRTLGLFEPAVENTVVRR